MTEIYAMLIDDNATDSVSDFSTTLYPIDGANIRALK